jgi:hypothetical protein
VRLAVALLALGVGACGGSDDAGPSASGAPCADDADCASDEVCAVGGVREMEIEPGDDARCVAESKAVGGAASSWSFTPGGTALAQRLCLAGGIDRGAGASSDATRARQKELLVATGVRVVRLDFPWSTVEPSHGAFDFSGLDPMVDVALSAGLEVIGILAYGTPWASSLTSNDDKYPPDDPADYAHYARAVAEHFQGKVKRFELWNEPNGGWRFFRPKLNGDASKYAEMMVGAADAIHQVCADCQVYSAGLFFHSQVVNGALEFTQDMLSANPAAFDSVDGFGIHPYTLYPPKTAPEDDASPERAVSGMVDDVRAVFDEHHATAPPLAATELGWPSYVPVSEALQASYLARELLLGASLGMDPLCWFNLADGPNHGTFPPEDDFGLYRFESDVPGKSIDPKPARDVLVFLSQLGADATPLGASDVGGFHDPKLGRFALDFDSPAGTWTALWQTGNVDVSWHFEGEARRAVDAIGNTVADPAVDLTIGGAPVFLVP